MSPQCVWVSEDQAGETLAYPDTLVGTDSHTTMVNGLGVLGWGVGGIEAEAAMLGQPVSMLIPEVVGFRLAGELREGITATDLVLTVTQMLRAKGVVGRFVEFYGPGLKSLSLADRATIANMAPEYGATCGFFPIDERTLEYLKLTGRDEERIALVRAYCQAQGLWRDDASPEPVFTDTLELDMTTIEPSLAGPAAAAGPGAARATSTTSSTPSSRAPINKHKDPRVAVDGEAYDLGNGDVVIAAITSCTNTSNPSVLVAAGLVARKARAKGLTSKPWVKTSLAPGSKVVSDYLDASGLSEDLNALGFDLVGYGCTTCIGNSGPLAEPISKAIADNDLVAGQRAVGQPQFRRPGVARLPRQLPRLAAAGRRLCAQGHGALRPGRRADRHRHQRRAGVPEGHLADQPGSPQLIDAASSIRACSVALRRRLYRRRPLAGDRDQRRRDLCVAAAIDLHPEPALFHRHDDDAGAAGRHRQCAGAGGVRRSITTDHISPAGAIKPDSPAGQISDRAQVVPRAEFNSYGARRGNHEVMMRGTFANIRIKNRMLDGVEGGFTRYAPTGETLPIYDAAMRYKADGTPLVVIAGKEYGTGSSRDWAAKGTVLLGVRAVIAESFERIHRSNLVGMGVLPLQFHDGESADEPRARRQRDVHASRRRGDRAAPGCRGRRSPGRRIDAAASPPAAGSTPTTSSNISTPAASCSTCCGGWRPMAETLVASCHCGRATIRLPRKPDYINHCNCSLCTRPASRASISRRMSCEIEGEFDSYVRSDLSRGYACKRCAARHAARRRIGSR